MLWKLTVDSGKQKNVNSITVIKVTAVLRPKERSLFLKCSVLMLKWLIRLRLSWLFQFAVWTANSNELNCFAELEASKFWNLNSKVVNLKFIAQKCCRSINKTRTK